MIPVAMLAVGAGLGLLKSMSDQEGEGGKFDFGQLLSGALGGVMGMFGGGGDGGGGGLLGGLFK